MANEYYHIFIGCGTEALGLFESQVLGLLSALRSFGVETLLLLFRRPSSDPAVLRDALETYGMSDRAIVLPDDPLRFIFPEKVAELVAARARSAAPGKGILLHCRSEAATLWGVRLRGLLGGPGMPSVRVLFDNRGIRNEEVRSHFHCHPYHEAKLLLHGAARFAASRTCDSYSFVTTAMRDHYQAHGYDSAKPTIVVPTCIDSARFPSGTSRQFDLAYCGSSWAWQNLEEVFALFSRLLGIDSKMRMLVLVDDPAVAAGVAAGIPPESLLITKVKGSDVPAMLLKCRAGLVLRDDSLINRVAAPIKIGEYLSAGMKVVYTGSIGSIKDLLSECPAAAACLINAASASAEEIIRSIAAPVESEVPDYFTWKRHLPKYGSLMP